MGSFFGRKIKFFLASNTWSSWRVRACVFTLINSPIDAFLEHPQFDPHGDPIPDENGKIIYHQETTLDQIPVKAKAIIVNVADQSAAFLQYLEKQQLLINSKVEVIAHQFYDHSITILFKGQQMFISEKVAKNIIVKKL